MAPLLIDSRDLLKFGFLTVLVTISVFAGGFIMGHQQAADFYQASNDIRPLSLPEPAITVESNVNSRVPSIIEAGEEIDVDQPETMTSASKESNNLMPGSVKSAVAVAQASVDEKEIHASQRTVARKITVSPKGELATGERTTGLNSDKSTAETQSATSTSPKAVSVKSNASSADVSIVSIFTSDELSKIKYSIQVGMYGRLINAENMMSLLQVQKYDAYVTDYTNKKNEIRYNVRFGYFSDKKLALETLAEFKTSQKGDGYLVKFSSDNIVKIAGVADIEKIADVPVHKNETDNRVTPVIVPSASTQDKVSQADILIDIPAIARLTTTN
jgi:cell division protein FtsN